MDNMREVVDVKVCSMFLLPRFILVYFVFINILHL
jgi:hypothetical protein